MTQKQPPSTLAVKKVILVDDHPMMRQGLAELINSQDDLEVCSEAGDAREALRLTGLRSPDLAIIDISLGGKSGLELIKELRMQYPDLFVLVVSMYEETFYAERALRAGAQGYIMKQAGGELLLEAIRKVLRGEIFLSKNLSAQVVDLYSGRRADRPRSPVEKLTDREFEIFQLIGQGQGTREIGQQLSLSCKTVDTHRRHIKEKLNLASTPELLRCAVCWLEAQNTGRAK